ncbi:PAS domain-containing protein [Fibrella arboris]|uniref:PAS domain-containing protein n=1 Tax=Fibrella arboris TaxID=3242486 RepID=UPI00351FA559
MNLTFPAAKESHRPDAPGRHDLFDLLSDKEYDELTGLAADSCQTRIGLISLVNDSRLWFTSGDGHTTHEAPHGHPFYSHALASPANILIVNDLRSDSRFADSPFVKGEPHIVFYAGAPLIDQEGVALGTLCVLDTEPRALSQRQLTALTRLANQVVSLLTARKQLRDLKAREAQYQTEKVVLETNEKRFKTIFEHAPIGLGLLRGPEHTFELVNERIAQMAGRTAEQMQGKPLLEALPELAQQGLKEIFDTVKQTGQRFVAPEIPVLLNRNNQLETAYFYASFEPVQEPDGSVSIVDFSLEITQQLQDQRELSASEARFRSIVEQAPMAIGQLKGRDMVIELGNQKIFEFWGKDPSIIGMRIVDALPELKDQPFFTILEKVYDTGEPYYGIGTLARLTRYGRLEDAYFDFSYTPIRDATNQISGIIVMAVEVTSQVLARQVIEQSEARFRGLIQEAPFAIGVYETTDFVIAIANEAMLAFWGKTAAVIGLKLADALPELEGQPFIGLLNNVYATGETYRSNEQRADLIVNGRLQAYWFNFVYQPLTNADGSVYAVLNMAVDVTERVLTRQRIEESERAYRNLAVHLESRVVERTQELTSANQDLLRSNESLQQFAYIASHDLQEPLRKIQSFGALLRDQYASQLDGQALDYLQRITSAGARMSLLIQDLLTYSRISTRPQTFDPVSLNAILTTVLDTLSLEIARRNAQIELSELPVVQGDELPLSQLFQNLLANAIKFTPAGKRPQINIDYAIRQRAELPTHLRPNSAAGSFHEISVRDQGVGFDMKYLDRIFHVFQRLHGKNEFAGTGVGLAICERVVANHGGGITASSKPGEGATFYVYLPAYSSITHDSIQSAIDSYAHAQTTGSGNS